MCVRERARERVERWRGGGRECLWVCSLIGAGLIQHSGDSIQKLNTLSLTPQTRPSQAAGEAFSVRQRRVFFFLVRDNNSNIELKAKPHRLLFFLRLFYDSRSASITNYKTLWHDGLSWVLYSSAGTEQVTEPICWYGSTVHFLFSQYVDSSLGISR